MAQSKDRYGFQDFAKDTLYSAQGIAVHNLRKLGVNIEDSCNYGNRFGVVLTPLTAAFTAHALIQGQVKKARARRHRRRRGSGRWGRGGGAQEDGEAHERRD